MLTGWDGNGFRATVHIPGLTRTGWSFDEIENPWLLFNSIEAFQEKLGVLPTFWQRSAKEIFVQTLRQRPVLCCDDPDEYWKPFIEKMESEFIWQRPLTEAENESPFVHAFDKRMMFLSAARGGMFGFGQYEEIGATNIGDIGKAVGLVEIEKPIWGHAFKPEFQQFLAELFSFGDDGGFIMTPYLRVLEQWTLRPIKIKRGWVWNKPERIFEKFAVKLGTAIKETRDSDAILANGENREINKAFKSMYTRFFGWLGRLEGRTGYGGELFRPDWRALIVAGAGANLLRNILDVFEYTGKLPFAINHDCIMYFSDSERWEMEFDKTAVADSNKFTHEWTATGDRVRAAIAEGLNPGQIEKAVQDGK